MILMHKAGKEAQMHIMIAHTLVTESGEVYVIECDICGVLALVTESPVDAMLEHSREVAL